MSNMYVTIVVSVDANGNFTCKPYETWNLIRTKAVDEWIKIERSSGSQISFIKAFVPIPTTPLIEGSVI